MALVHTHAHAGARPCGVNPSPGHPHPGWLSGCVSKRQVGPRKATNGITSIFLGVRCRQSQPRGRPPRRAGPRVGIAPRVHTQPLRALTDLPVPGLARLEAQPHR